MAVNNLLVRKLPQHHNVFQTLMLTNLVGIPAALGLALWEGKPWDWTPMLTATGSNTFILINEITVKSTTLHAFCMTVMEQ